MLLTLWDIARDNPDYNRRLWGELQHHLSQLETRNNMLCALLSDLLHCTDDAGNVLWNEASIHSPPGGYAIKFLQEELERERRPKMPKTPETIPTNDRGEAVAPTDIYETRSSVKRPVPPRGAGGAYDPVDVLMGIEPPPVPPSFSKVSEAEERLIDDLTVDYGALNPSPIGVGDEYDVGDEDEEDELAFDFSSSDDTTQ